MNGVHKVKNKKRLYCAVVKISVVYRCKSDDNHSVLTILV